MINGYIVRLSCAVKGFIVHMVEGHFIAWMFRWKYFFLFTFHNANSSLKYFTMKCFAIKCLFLWLMCEPTWSVTIRNRTSVRGSIIKGIKKYKLWFNNVFLLYKLFFCVIHIIITRFVIYLKGSESCPSRGLLLGLLARGQPDKLRCDE